MFRHALIQDVAYQALLNRTRRQHHRRIGEVLLADHREVAELQQELIARHFSEAGLPEEELPFWTRAAERALKRSANYEAVSPCARALATASELQDAEAKRPQLFAAVGTASCRERVCQFVSISVVSVSFKIKYNMHFLIFL